MKNLEKQLEMFERENRKKEQAQNRIKQIEKSKNSQLARNLIFAIPRELNEEERIKLVTDFVEDNFISKGMIADVNIHNSIASDGGEQPHAHILLTLREIDEKGKWKAKSKKVYVLEDNGEKIKLPSGNYKSYKEDINDWNKRENATKWREDFSKKVNGYLAKNNIDKRIAPRTFKEQGREELPQIHLGTSSYQMEQKGIKTERGNINRRIIAINNDLKNSLREIAEVGRWIGRITRAVILAFKELSKEKEMESKFEPQLFDLYTYLKAYDKMQNEIALTLDSKNKARKRNSDTKKSLHTLAYMRSKNIKIIIDFQKKKDEVNKNLSDNKAEINDIKARLKTLETCFKQAEIMNKHKKIYNKFVNMDNSFMSRLKNQSKDDFYKQHKTRIEKVRKAKSILKNLSDSNNNRSSSRHNRKNH